MDEKSSVAPLFQHQKEMFVKALNKNGYAFFVEMGLGKTRVAIELALKRNQRTLIIAPNTVLENWAQEVQKWSNGTAKCAILSGLSEEKRYQLKHTQAQFVVVNYEALRLIEAPLIDAGFQFIIADESSKLKGYKTKQSVSAFHIAQTIPYRLIMTGTPVTNNPLDLFGQMRFLSPFILGKSYYAFRARYAIMGGYNNYQVKKWINLDQLKDVVYKHGCSYLKKDCLDLPPKIYETEHIDLTDEQRTKYKELKNEFITEFQGEIVNAAVVLTRLIRFSQITSGFLKVGEAEAQREIPFPKNPKIEWLKEFLEDRLPSDAKVVIFCRFIHDIKGIQRLCKDLNIGYATIYGAVENRQEMVDNFNNNPKVRVFIGQIQTSGMGINLTAASYVVYYSNSYSYGDRIQSEDRAHRIGQSKNVTYIDLVCRGTVDELILKSLGVKKNLADYIVDVKAEDLL